MPRGKKPRANTRAQPPAAAPSRATVSSVAKLAKVSGTTVSLAYQENSRISDATRRRVLEAARRLRYVPNRNAQSLRAGRSRLVGLLVNDFANPFYTRMAESIETRLEARGYRFLLFNNRWDAGREIEAVRQLLALRAEGALVCHTEKTPESARLLRENGLPSVALNTPAPGGGGAFVANDLEYAGRLAACHFAELGCRAPALLCPSAASFSAFARLERGFADEWRRRGGAAPRWLACELTIASGVAGFLALRREAAGVDAVLCGNDLCALGVIDAADSLGVAVGGKLAVMGIDDLAIGALSRLGLSTLREPVERMAELATETLLDAIEQGTPPRAEEWLAPELVARATTLRFRPRRAAPARRP